MLSEKQTSQTSEEVTVGIEVDITEVEEQESLLNYLRQLTDALETDVSMWDNEAYRAFCRRAVERQSESRREILNRIFDSKYVDEFLSSGNETWDE